MDTSPTISDPAVPKLAYSIAESTAATGLSRSSIYRLIAAGKLKTIQLGARRLVPKTELERLCRADSEPAQ